MPKIKHRNKQSNKKNKKKKKQRIWVHDFDLSHHASHKHVSQDALNIHSGSYLHGTPEDQESSKCSLETSLPSNWTAVTSSTEDQSCHGIHGSDVSGEVNSDSGWEEYWKLYREHLLWENWIQKYPDQADLKATNESSWAGLERQHQVQDGNTDYAEDKSNNEDIWDSCTQGCPHVVDASSMSKTNNVLRDSAMATRSEHVSVCQNQDNCASAGNMSQVTVLQEDRCPTETSKKPDQKTNNFACTTHDRQLLENQVATAKDVQAKETDNLDEKLPDGPQGAVLGPEAGTAVNNNRERFSSADMYGRDKRDKAGSTSREWTEEWSHLWDVHCAEVYWYYHQYYHANISNTESCGHGVQDDTTNQSEKSTSEMTNQSGQPQLCNHSYTATQTWTGNSQSQRDVHVGDPSLASSSLDESSSQSKSDRISGDTIDQSLRDVNFSECIDKSFSKTDSEDLHPGDADMVSIVEESSKDQSRRDDCEGGKKDDGEDGLDSGDGCGDVTIEVTGDVEHDGANRDNEDSGEEDGDNGDNGDDGEYSGEPFDGKSKRRKNNRRSQESGDGDASQNTGGHLKKKL